MGCECEKDKPKHGGKPFTKAVVEIVNPEKITLLRKVIIPASLGDETTIPPAVGEYHNVILYYEASKNVYLYSSDGIPTLIGTDVSLLEEAVAKLQEDLTTEITDREDADTQLSDEIADVASDLADETTARETADSALDARITDNSTGITGLTDSLADEISNRQNADTNLQGQIDAISASSDVKDIVGTYAELQNYDASTLSDNDIVKVLQDETQNGATTYYRWNSSTQRFTLIGEEGPFYTKSEADSLLATKQNVLTAGNNIQINGTTISATDTTYSAGNGLNLTGTTFSADTDVLQEKLTAGENISISNNTISATDTTYTAGDGLELDGTEFSIDNTVALKSELPTVNDATLTIQKNGSDVASFTANSGTNVTANISVPTDTAQLSNGAGYQTASDVQSLIIGKQDVLTAGNNIQITGNTISATDTKYSAGAGLNLTGTVFSADTETLATRDYVNSSIPTDVSELNNDAGYITNTVNNLTNYTPTANLATVATSGNYNDLLNRPTIPAAQINSDWNAVSGVAQILNKPTNVSAFANDAGYLTSVSWGDVSGKPTFATVATSGSYNDLSDKPTIPTVPTNVSAFTNDAGYQNSAQVQNAISAAVGGITTLDYQVVQTLPATGVKGIIYLVPNSGTTPNVYDEYIWVPNRTDGSFEKIGTTEVDLSNYVTDSELTATLAGYAQSSSLATVATSGSYNDLTNKPTIPTVPTNVSAFTNDAGYQTASDVATAISGKQDTLVSGTNIKTINNTSLLGSGNVSIPVITVDSALSATSTNPVQNKVINTALNNKVNTGDLASVATSGSYNDLSNKPTIPAAQVNSDWNSNSGVSQILNKPTLATVATSGAYSDLSGKPTIPTVNNATLTIQRNGTSVGTFTANASSNRTINIAVPTATSDLTNDSGFITSITKITNAEIDAIMGVA